MALGTQNGFALDPYLANPQETDWNSGMINLYGKDGSQTSSLYKTDPNTWGMVNFSDNPVDSGMMGAATDYFGYTPQVYDKSSDLYKKLMTPDPEFGFGEMALLGLPFMAAGLTGGLAGLFGGAQSAGSGLGLMGEAGFGAGGAMDMGVGLGEVAQGITGSGSALAGGGSMGLNFGDLNISDYFNSDNFLSDYDFGSNPLMRTETGAFQMNPSIPDFPIGGEAGSIYSNSSMPSTMWNMGMRPGSTLYDMFSKDPLSAMRLASSMIQGSNQQKNPLGILSALYGAYNQNSMEKMLKDMMSQAQANQFPHSQYYGLAAQFADPAKRMEMLRGNAGFQAAQDYVKQAQLRRNARTGDLKSGYGDALMADVLGRNAAAWENQMFGQIKDMSGMSFNNAQNISQTSAAAIPAMYKGRGELGTQIGQAIMGNMGYLPEVLNWMWG